MLAHLPKGMSTCQEETAPSVEIACLCLEGLLPQHIRNIISKVSIGRCTAFPDHLILIVSHDIDAVTTLLSSYQDALNSSNIDKITTLYAPDGILMAPNSPTAVGIPEIRRLYDGLFAAFILQVKFEVIEIVPTAPNWAFARTWSTGIVTGKDGDNRPDTNHDLFILQKIGGEWRIARYCFSRT